MLHHENPSLPIMHDDLFVALKKKTNEDDEELFEEKTRLCFVNL